MAENRMWSLLMHMGFNMWAESTRRTYLRCDRSLWNDTVQKAKTAGIDTLIIDVGEALRFEKHPELAVDGSLSREEMQNEVARLRAMGFEVVPKLNFSTCHNGWLGEYSRMVSTTPYYRVCEDVIAETCEVFKPKYFHIGMDEEDMKRMDYDYVVIRQNDLWWHDLYHIIDNVEKHGARAWAWSDYVCDHKDEYLQKMPKSVIQNTWYYLDDFVNRDPAVPQDVRNYLERRIRALNWLADAGYDQVAVGSIWSTCKNMSELVKYCETSIDNKNLLGYMQTIWEPCIEEKRDRYILGVDNLAETRELYLKTYSD